MKKNNKGFTLIELLAVIVILGLLMAIAIPSVTRYITQSRKKTLVSTMDSYVTAVTSSVNENEFGAMSKEDTMYYVPVSNEENNSCISLEKGGTDPFGNWKEAYVVVDYDADNYSYDYYFTFYDDAGYGMELTKIEDISASSNQITNPSPVNEDNITTQKNDRATNVKVLTPGSCKVVTAVNGGTSAKIPVNGVYYVGVTSSRVGDYSGATAIYRGGNKFPETVQTGDVYVDGDYEYRYNYSWMEGWSKNTSQNGWDVRVLDVSKSSYSAIKEEIAGKPITNMSATFMGCGNLVVAPSIPKTVTSLTATFCACSSLKSVSLSKNITYIGENGLSYCSNLKDIYYEGDATQWSAIRNSNVDASIKNATIHYNSIN